MASSPVVCVAIVVERDGHVLLLRRGPDRTWPGTWCMPGGRLERGETLATCCVRELCEETGLEAERFEFAGPRGITEVIGGPGRDDAHLVGLVYHAVGVRGEPENWEPDKHDAIGWFPWPGLAMGEPCPLMPGVVRYVRATFGDGVLLPEQEKYRSILDGLLEDGLEGRWVVIREVDVLTSFASFEDALGAGYETFGFGPWMVKQVLTFEPVHRVRA